ncbi:MAG: 2-isopropylmalate synthase [Spirochaetales bacterium]|nr:2-isopropylmalate synthase [Spirochaetales bacterium]
MAKYKDFPKIQLKERTWPDNVLKKAPRWCSVDLRDGNQALAVPMNIQEKKEYFQLLVNMGFKEIEIGFPSASQIEFDFLRTLIEENLVPDDVYLQVLTQAREHLIRRTFESLKGAKKAIVHVYNSTSPLQRDITFNLSKDAIKNIAIDGVKLIKSLLHELPDTQLQLEYSPESFSSTEIDYSVEVCQAVREAWRDGELPKNVSPVIIFNLPATVEESTPNIHADQVEYFCRHIGDRESVVVSLHTHNDRGTGIAATELGLLAGADRVEGTLFGNGERTGNLDIITVALNMFSRGIDPELDVFDLPAIQEIYERCTAMRIPPRHPYAGELVFTAFSGSHQDAIKKGLDRMNASGNKDTEWRVPYLPIDPKDIGRSYEAIIRINSQSGKGGVAYVLQAKYGYELPKLMHPVIGKIVNEISDNLGRELDSKEILDIFKNHFLSVKEPLALISYATQPEDGNATEVVCTANVIYNGKELTLKGSGNGPISAFVAAMKTVGWNSFDIIDFHEQSLGEGSNTDAVAYVGIKTSSECVSWGAGQHSDITTAGILALISAYNVGYRQSGKK